MAAQKRPEDTWTLRVPKSTRKRLPKTRAQRWADNALLLAAVVCVGLLEAAPFSLAAVLLGAAVVLWGAVRAVSVLVVRRQHAKQHLRKVQWQEQEAARERERRAARRPARR